MISRLLAGTRPRLHSRRRLWKTLGWLCIAVLAGTALYPLFGTLRLHVFGYQLIAGPVPVEFADAFSPGWSRRRLNLEGELIDFENRHFKVRGEPFCRVFRSGRRAWIAISFAGHEMKLDPDEVWVN